ncbi:hypothetical protein ACO22_07417 [Paracoccidioides brasiliensis]|uniref:chitinase n=1 Tax=Paracoccidioides brasiliensis TaxID=121759 RepID=A0A1D2J4N9_PARBR|nr:hypothetical protein ACO22_07417 [Paracoccidioides brasiliensis]
MVLKRLFTAVVAVFSLLHFAAALDLLSRTNLVVYYGQAPDQPRLRDICLNDRFTNVIILAFVNVFPEQGKGGYPGTNFGNQCSAQVFKNEEGVDTELLSGCQNLIEDIPVCQSEGVRVMLSLGGGLGSYAVTNKRAAEKFADFLWGAFGPKTPAWANKPRPFGDVIIDGFDFDIEHNRFFGYPAKEFLISAAPQCPVTERELDSVIKYADFDFISIQFYNTYECSARNWVIEGDQSGFTSTLDEWMRLISDSVNPGTRVLFGLPGAPDAAQAGYYLNVREVGELFDEFMVKYPDQIGGAMLWDATYALRNEGRKHDHHHVEQHFNDFQLYNYHSVNYWVGLHHFVDNIA